ncbi:MAG: class I SAM-dependent methyltransferase [Actinomycetota bacterium]|nr:class I SAM-dependent methyltransferase [Actinomycetota bacterium]
MTWGAQTAGPRRDGKPYDAPIDTSPDQHWFEPLADHLGSAYLRYSFTKGTEQEVGFLVEALGLRPGMRVLDVGCGPGRHAHALGRRGIGVHGVDISQRFIDIAREMAPDGVTFARLDARRLPFVEDFDAAISLCQGAFGLAGGVVAAGADDVGADPDLSVIEGMARALRPGGRVAISAFSAYFQVRWLDEGMTFDAARGVNHERSELRSETGERATHDLWTSCFTPRELSLMARAAGLRVDHVWAVTPGEYGEVIPDLAHEEFLLLATRGAALEGVSPPVVS